MALRLTFRSRIMGRFRMSSIEIRAESLQYGSFVREVELISLDSAPQECVYPSP